MKGRKERPRAHWRGIRLRELHPPGRLQISKANPAPVGSWPLLTSLDSLVKACQEGEKRVASTRSVADLASLYVSGAGKIEREHLRLRGAAMSHGLSSINKVADRAYAGYTNLLNEKFFPLEYCAGLML